MCMGSSILNHGSVYLGPPILVGQPRKPVFNNPTTLVVYGSLDIKTTWVSLCWFSCPHGLGLNPMGFIHFTLRITLLKWHDSSTRYESDWCKHHMFELCMIIIILVLSYGMYGDFFNQTTISYGHTCMYQVISIFTHPPDSFCHPQVCKEHITNCQT